MICTISEKKSEDTQLETMAPILGRRVSRRALFHDFFTKIRDKKEPGAERNDVFKKK
jgi:hypothetical protein